MAVAEEFSSQSIWECCLLNEVWANFVWPDYFVQPSEKYLLQLCHTHSILRVIPVGRVWAKPVLPGSGWGELSPWNGRLPGPCLLHCGLLSCRMSWHMLPYISRSWYWGGVVPFVWAHTIGSGQVRDPFFSERSSPGLTAIHMWILPTINGKLLHRMCSLGPGFGGTEEQKTDNPVW